jgi:hypothetical protein
MDFASLCLLSAPSHHWLWDPAVYTFENGLRAIKARIVGDGFRPNIRGTKSKLIETSTADSMYSPWCLQVYGLAINCGAKFCCGSYGHYIQENIHHSLRTYSQISTRSQLVSVTVSRSSAWLIFSGACSSSYFNIILASHAVRISLRAIDQGSGLWHHVREVEPVHPFRIMFALFLDQHASGLVLAISFCKQWWCLVDVRVWKLLIWG